MNKSRISKWVICLSLIIVTNLLNAQTLEVTAEVDRNPVMVDESFILTVTANGEVNRNAFDASFLMKDFVVGRTSVSSQTNVINFKTTKTTTWSTVLIPQKKGRFNIPSFDVNGAKTKPIEVLVVPVSSNSPSSSRDLFITTNVDVKQVYLQQQIRYTVKLHLDKDLQRGSLSSPKLENADIRQIGKDKEYSEIIDNRRYRIIERSFAIIAQQSGTFTIEGPLFEGEVVDNSRQNFGFFNRSKAVNRVGPSQSITVLPIPKDYNHPWLPSDYVQLDDEWQGNNQKFTVGEPITRTITLTATGVVEEQLPDITSQYPDSVKTYPDQAETATVEKDNTLIAQRKESIAIIPSMAGKIVVPEVRIPWFNTMTQKTEYAVLPEKTLDISAATTTGNSAIPLPPVPQNEPLTSELAPQPQIVSHTVLSVPKYWIALTIGLFILWLVTLLLWWKHVSKLKATLKPKSDSSVNYMQNEQKLWKALEYALNKNQHNDTQKYLALWLGINLQDKKVPLIKSLTSINNPALSAAVNDLLATQYSKNQSQWQSTELHQILRKIRKEGTIQKQTKQNLPPLYPTL